METIGTLLLAVVLIGVSGVVTAAFFAAWGYLYARRGE